MLSAELQRDPASHERAFAYYARLSRLKAHLVANISEPLSAQGAASIAGVSGNYFSTFFHDCVGLRYTAWARIVRIGKAQELIAGSNASIAEVAERVGFNDLRTFQRAFKAVTALTPRQYKAKVRPAGRLAVRAWA